MNAQKVYLVVFQHLVLVKTLVMNTVTLVVIILGHAGGKSQIRCKPQV